MEQAYEIKPGLCRYSYEKWDEVRIKGARIGWDCLHETVEGTHYCSIHQPITDEQLRKEALHLRSIVESEVVGEEANRKIINALRWLLQDASGKAAQ